MTFNVAFVSKLLTFTLTAFSLSNCSLSLEELAMKGCECYAYPENENSEEACKEFKTNLKHASLNTEDKLIITIAVEKCMREKEKREIEIANQIIEDLKNESINSTKETIDSLKKLIDSIQ